MEFFIKKMEVIEEVLVSFFFVSFELDISDMEVCKIIFIGLDYVSDSVQSFFRKQEFFVSLEKGGVFGIIEVFFCFIIFLCRESEDESGDFLSQV